jgi:hypothetical protein
MDADGDIAFAEVVEADLFDPDTVAVRVVVDAERAKAVRNTAHGIDPSDGQGMTVDGRRQANQVPKATFIVLYCPFITRAGQGTTIS